MNDNAFHHNITPRGTSYHIVQRDALIVSVNTSLSVFETEVTELERLWIIHDKNRTTDPTTFAIGVSLWRPRRKSLQDRLNAYWSAEHSKGYDWVTYYVEKQEKRGSHPDRAIGTANVMFRAQHDGLVQRCEQLGFLDYLQVGFLSGTD